MVFQGRAIGAVPPMQERFAKRFAEFEDFNRTCDRRKVNVTCFGLSTSVSGAEGAASFV